ncbi:MAG TPA: OmpA family protein [Candidatus Binatia bacterium]|nr:OmpA family protein [Candidatus Binatia bacterium]
MTVLATGERRCVEPTLIASGRQRGEEPDAVDGARAQAVATYLQSQGIAKDRLMVQGYGAASLAAANPTKHGRKRNRRVEVTVQ